MSDATVFALAWPGKRRVLLQGWAGNGRSKNVTDAQHNAKLCADQKWLLALA